MAKRKLRNSARRKIIVAALIERDGMRCFWCACTMTRLGPDQFGRTPMTDATIDHLKALRDGGSNARKNLVLACHSCNITRDRDETWVSHRERATA